MKAMELAFLSKVPLPLAHTVEKTSLAVARLLNATANEALSFVNLKLYFNHSYF
jgi:hypothetical protein